MKTSIIAVAAVFSLAPAAPASAQSMGEKTGVNSVLGVAPTTADFVKEAALTEGLGRTDTSPSAAPSRNGA